MLKPGIYHASNDESIWNAYDVKMEVKETDKSYIFELVSLESHYAADHIKMLFKKSNRFVLRKDQGGHAMRVWDDTHFTIYPFQAGIPYYFKMEPETDRFKKLCDDFSKRRPAGKPTGRCFWFTTEFASGSQCFNDLLRKYLIDRGVQYLNTLNGDVWFLFQGEWRMCEFKCDGNKVDVYMLEFDLG